MRGGDIGGDEEFNGIVCPVCFATLAEERGIARGWTLTPRRVLVELQTVTPGGRIWNDERQLWDEPATT